MKKYQDILRDQTSRNFAAKDVNTSLLLLPLRLETKITNRNIETTDEAERVLYAFRALHDLLKSYYTLLSSTKTVDIEEKTNNVKQKIQDVICTFTKIDLLYTEDKAYLKDLVNNIYNTLHTVELQDAFAPVFDTFDDITRITSRSDKQITNLLNRFDRIVRSLEHTVRHPEFSGWRRMAYTNTYSQIARFRVAYRRYKEADKFLREIVDVVEVAPDNVTPSQCAKFERLVERLKKLIANAPEGNEYTILTHYYPLDNKKNDDQSDSDSTDKRRPASLYNKNEYYTRFTKMAQSLYENLNSFLDDSKSENNWRDVCKELKAKVLYKERLPRNPTRFSILVSRFLGAELSIVKAYLNTGTKRRRVYMRDAYHTIKELNNLNLIKTTYFYYKEQCDFAIELIEYINKLLKLLTSDIDETININSSTIDAIKKCVLLDANGIFGSKKTEKCLCVRIFPDVVALTQTARQISRAEYLVGKDFWLKYIYNTDVEYRQSLWLAVCDMFPAYRSAFILKRTFPKANYKVMCRKAMEFHDNSLSLEDFMKEIDDNFVNSFPTTYVDNGEQLFSVPVTNLLPDRFVVRASVKVRKNATAPLVCYGHRLPRQLQVGLDLNNLENATNTDDTGKLKLNGGLSWMTDYDEAERMGMAITIPLSSVEKGMGGFIREDFEFSEIFVYGINDADADEADKMIEDLFTAHLYSDKAMDILSFDAASNILTTEDAKYAFDSSEEVQRERFKHQAYNCVNPHKPEKGNDLDILDRLFCLKESVIGNIDVPGEAGTSEVELQRCVNRLMLEYLTNDRLSGVVNPLLAAIESSPTLHDYLCKDVLPRGPFPMLRIGDQPYGILPVCDIKHLAVNSANPLAIVKKILVLLTTHWNNILSQNIVNCYGKDTNSKDYSVTTDDYLNILGNTPQSTSFYKRKTVKGHLIDAEYFRGETYQHQIEELYGIATSLGLIRETEGKEKIKEIIPDYDAVSLINKDGANATDDVCFVKEALSLDYIVNEIVGKITDINRRNVDGIQLSTNVDVLRKQIIEFFDLFNYRLDAWLMGLLNNKLRRRMEKGKHRIALGCFGWLFNLKEKDAFKYGCNDEYILAPSVNHAITGAIMRSSYNYSIKNGKPHDYNMSVNLSSERVRSAIRIIEGIQNGLSLGAILGADMERLIHEAYKADKEMELDSCIYKLRQRYPLVEADCDRQPIGDKKADSKEAMASEITVFNGAMMLEEYLECKSKAAEKARKVDDVEMEIFNWLKKLGLFEGDSVRNDKIKKLREIIDVIDDERDALTDVVLTESVYKLTQGNTEASTAISKALRELKNIPMPEVTEIPVASAQIDGHMLAMLPAYAESSQTNSILAATEPKVEAWIRKMMYNPSDIYIQIGTQSLGDLGISASEMVYLSADKASFIHFVEVLHWMKTGTFTPMSASGDIVEVDNNMVPFCDCAMAIDDLRKLLAGAHALTNDDLVKKTGLDSAAVYSEMSNEYHHVEGYITRILGEIDQLCERQTAIQNPDNANYDMAAVPDDMVAEAVRILLDCYRIGNTMALDCVNEDIFIGERNALDGVVEWKHIVDAQHALFQSLLVVRDNMKQKLDQATKLIVGDAERKHTTYVEALKNVLVPGYLIVPSFRPDVNVPLADLADQTNGYRFNNVSEMELEEILCDMSKVEAAMMNLHQVRMFQKCNDIMLPRIVPMQLTSAEDNTSISQWLGTTVKSEDDVMDAFTYIVMDPECIESAARMQQPVLAGIVIDHWIERIPYRDQTAAVAFGYDQPDAEAPQTLLLAVSTMDNKKRWNENMLVNSLKSAIHMVKCRTVSPDMLCKDGWASGIFPLLDFACVEKREKAVPSRGKGHSRPVGHRPGRNDTPVGQIWGKR